MTTLYRPVLLESAEQAEELPAGAILHRGRGARGLTGMVLRSPYTDRTYFRVGVEHWPVSRIVETFAEVLVPVEAEEEWIPDASAIAPWPEPAPDPLPGKSRFVTLWEPA